MNGDDELCERLNHAKRLPYGDQPPLKASSIEIGGVMQRWTNIGEHYSFFFHIQRDDHPIRPPLVETLSWRSLSMIFRER